METEFTPLASLGGGALIGLAAVLLMGAFGRIFGATGILSGLVAPDSLAEFKWRAVLIAGMVSGPVAMVLVSGNWPEIAVPAPAPLLALGGLIVGLGVTYGGGCTSGHGVCGIARLSSRSIAATLLFMASTVVTVYLMRHTIGAY